MSTTSAAQEPTAHRAWRILLALIVIASGFSLAGLTLSAAPAQAANVTINQCNDRNAGPTGATTGITCTVTVVNTIRGGQTSSTVTVTRQCSLTPCAPGNGSFTTSSSNLVTRVTQCNGSGNDAAPPLITCNVTVTNNISADSLAARPRTAATVNQCVGTGTGGGLYGGTGPLVCDPYPASTTNATVTQCNGSVTGGGSTAVCSVATGSRISAAIPIRVNQCNGTGNAGGTLLTCRTTIRTNITAARATTTPTAAATPGAGTPQITAVPSGGVPAGGGTGGGLGQGALLSLGGALLLAGSATALLGWRAARER